MKNERRIAALALQIGLWRMNADGIEKRAAERERLYSAAPWAQTPADKLKLRRRGYNATARAAALRREVAVMARELETLERQQRAEQGLEKELGL